DGIAAVYGRRGVTDRPRTGSPIHEAGAAARGSFVARSLPSDRTPGPLAVGAPQGPPTASCGPARHETPAGSRPAGDPADPAAQARGPSGSVVVPEEEGHERVVEPPAAGEDDRRMLAEAEAPPDVEPEHQRGAERGPQAEPVASPRALGLLALQPARADVGEEGALDPREPDFAEREGHGEAMQDREPPFLVQEPEARAGEGIARVSAQLVRAAEYGARRDRAVAEEPVEADGIRAV